MDKSFSSLLNEASSVLIILPQNPSYDEVAAGLSLFLAIRDDKEVSIYCPSQMLVEFNRLVGVNKVTTELGNKNLLMKFEDYPAGNIERVSYDVEDGQFRLTIIPKTGFTSPQKGQVKLSYTGISADTVVLISGKSQNDFPAVSSKDLLSSKLIHIGTRQLTLEGGGFKLISLATPSSCVSEALASLLKDNNLDIDNDCATNLLTGIERGSKRFTSSEVSANTFEIVAFLMKRGGKRLSLLGPAKGVFQSPITVDRVEPPKPKGPPKSWLEPKIYKGTSIS